MILQIATRSGVPPSKIADEWTVDELRDAEVLSSLEGWGQEKRRNAALMAEIHNAIRLAVWARNGDPKAPAPKRFSESHFLPRRVKQVDAIKRVQGNNNRLFAKLNAWCGY